MLVLFTDFGLTGPYTGQMKAVLMRQAPGVPVVDLFADAPAFDPRASAYLLAAYADAFYQDDVFLCVVDPGVGTDRQAVVARLDGRWFIGPDNGLLAITARRAHRRAEAWRIDWRPKQLSSTFHGRDLFAPVAARIAVGEPPPGARIPPASLDRPDWPDDWAAVVYVDRYGNAMTGLRGTSLPPSAVLIANGQRVEAANTFADRPPGTAFWHVNSNGLVEIAVNQGRADVLLDLDLGSEILLET